MGDVHSASAGVPCAAVEQADHARLRRFAEDAWRELREVGERDVFLYGYLEAEAAALGIGDAGC